jgi:hypothetical protein
LRAETHMKLPVPTGTTKDPEQLRTTMPSGLSAITGQLQLRGICTLLPGFILYFKTFLKFTIGGVVK